MMNSGSLAGLGRSFRSAAGRALAGVAFVFPLFVGNAGGQVSEAPTFSTTSRLVYLDVTVLDRQGKPVVTGLTKDDFTITENRKKQAIFSFEAPEVHAGSESEAPVTIFVLDLLNSGFEDFAYIRYEVRKYLKSQPGQLKSPAELMVLGNQSLEMLQSLTRSKEELLEALNHVPVALPYKMNPSFFIERFGQSVDALQQIALENRGIPGRKNVIWVGRGGPGLLTYAFAPSTSEKLMQYVHGTTNLLVDSRISLFVIYPGLPVNGGGFTRSTISAQADPGEQDPFAGDINFGVFVNETGGKLFYNRNDVDGEMKQSQEFGSKYYTLTYRPEAGNDDGKFRRVRVSVRDPKLHVLTKTGYFARDENVQADSREKVMSDVVEALRSSVPFPALKVGIENAVRHSDVGTVEYTVTLKRDDVTWEAAEDGKSTAKFLLATASLDRGGYILAARIGQMVLTANTQDPKRLPDPLTKVSVTQRMPRRTAYVRAVIIQQGEGGRIGAAQLDNKAMKAAPETASPKQTLIQR